MSFIKLKKSFFFFCHTVQYVKFPQPGLEPCPLQRKHIVSITGSPGKSEEVPFYSLFVEFFFLNYERTLDFVRFFFHVYWDDYMGFVFHSIAMICYTKWFSDVKPPLHSWSKSCLFMCWWTWFAGILRIFVLLFNKKY